MKHRCLPEWAPPAPGSNDFWKPCKARTSVKLKPRGSLGIPTNTCVWTQLHHTIQLLHFRSTGKPQQQAMRRGYIIIGESSSELFEFCSLPSDADLFHSLGAEISTLGCYVERYLHGCVDRRWGKTRSDNSIAYTYQHARLVRAGSQCDRGTDQPIPQLECLTFAQSSAGSNEAKSY
ncbi:hypothetical protein BD779DRAFT_1565206 [Infundibulicybe gibba]|nr:hypothetical protein BD779DRAFT_1565206 [Infundibulicybe gibba]